MVSTNSPKLASQDSRVLQHGIHAERSFADLLGWAWQRRGRSTQGCERPGRAGRWRGVALSARLLSPGNRPKRHTARSISVQRSRTIANQAPARCKWRLAPPADYFAGLQALDTLLGSTGGTDQALP